MAHKKIRDFASQPLVARKSAVASGLKQYFNAVPCLVGHVAPRYTNNAKCVVCSAVDALAWQKRMYDERPADFRQMCRDKKLKNPVAYMLTGVRSRAAKRGIQFSITAADIQVPAECPCCTRPLQMRSGPAKQGPLPGSPSIDRIEGALGYVPGNVIVICWRCNELKRNATADELRTVLNWMESIHHKPALRLVA